MNNHEAAIRELVDLGYDDFGILSGSDVAALLNTIDGLRANVAELEARIASAPVAEVPDDVVREIYGCHTRKDLENDPAVKAAKPIGQSLEIAFEQYDDTNVCQWHVKTEGSPFWRPRGPLFRLAAKAKEGEA